MTIGSLFDGSGAFPFAGVLCGIEPVWASEIEPFPIAVTTKRFPHMKHLGDVCKIDGSKIEPVDVITFGSPCQDMSVAGKREGLEGARSNLFYEAVRIIKEMREATNGKYPAFIVWENVTGAFTSNKGEDFLAVLRAIVGIADKRADVPRPTERWREDGIVMGDNYSVAWRTMHAEFWGVPQKRHRVFLVADFRGQRAPEILFEREGLQRDFAEVKSAWSRTVPDSAAGAGTSRERKEVVNVENHPQASRTRERADGICQTLTTRMGTGGGNVPLVAENINYFDWAFFNFGINTKYRSQARTDGKTGTLVARGPGAVAYSFSPKSQGEASQKDTANALVASDYKDPQTVTTNDGKIWTIRKLTPLECCRLMGMPDWWCSDVPHSDTAEYKMWGNGVVLPCVLYIVEGIAATSAK